MFGTIAGLLVFVVLTILFGWLTRKSWRAHRAWVKWIGVVSAGLFMLILALLSVLGTVGTYKLFRPNIVSLPQVIVDGTPEQVTCGEYLSNVLCASCHSLNGELPMTGART